MRKIILIILVLLYCLPTITDAQVTVYSQPEEGIDGVGRGRGVTPLHGITASNGYLYGMFRNDSGTDYSIYYSDDQGATWSALTSALNGHGDGRLGYCVSFSDTAYVWGSSGGTTPNEIFKIFGASIVARDTVYDISFSAKFFRELANDTLMYVAKTSNYYLSTNFTTDRLVSSAIFTRGDSVGAFAAQNQESWAFGAVSDGVLGICLATTFADSAWFWNSNNVYLVDESITDGFEQLGVQNTATDFIQLIPADPEDVNNDTLAIVIQNDSTNRIEFILGYVDPASSYIWTEIRRTWVNDPGTGFVLTTLTTNSSPCGQRTREGAWIVYGGNWADTSLLGTKSLNYWISTNDGATWDAGTILLPSTGADVHHRYRCALVTPPDATGDSLLVGVLYANNWTNSMSARWIGDVIAVIDVGPVAPSEANRRQTILRSD